ncbi:phage/plasmid primase, P4 family [Sphingobium sp. HDIP04]|uniref:phage/plasmid primase, P4 family n=1 Tax=Sphingobium sp. HDIP04 TaxID=428994 RepID=UPI0003877D94|nr:phage/plasmid primase, P4 family [Sphingobium sp. HDIP04]EQB03902.1 hypothetical protein L286_11090 [Sphingobium sp. HDIP04]
MQDKFYTETVAFITRFFGVHDHAVELRACPNVKGNPGAESLITRDSDALRDFCRRKDVDGIGVYFGACTRRRDADNGSAANAMTAPALWVDIDCVKQGLGGQQVIDALEFLPHRPTLIINSGGGLHAYWMLEEAVDLAADRERVTAALRALAHILAGDMACAEVARIMRLPGTMNSKDATKAIYDGQSALCEIVSDNGSVHDFDTLCEWLEDQRAVLHGKVEAARPVRENDPFVAYARAAGYEPAIDVEAELASMAEGNIHRTQLRVSMSMIARGYEDDEIVATILTATERAAPRDQRWNWKAEEKAIRKMIVSGKQKAQEREERMPVRSMPRFIGNAALKLVPDVDEEADEQPEKTKAPRESKSNTVAVGRAAIGVWKDRHGPVMHTNGSTFAYDEGIWVEWDERLAQRLRAIIQEACASLGIEPKTSLLNAAKAFFMDRPEWIRHNVEFDQHGLLIANDACINLQTMQVIVHSPEHYATRKIAASLNGDRNCPALRAFMAEAFSDREEAAAIISTIQEWVGSAIVPLELKTRDMLKGLLVHGASRCGKTQVSELVRWLLGHDHICGSRMSDLSDRFGREPLIGKRGWIADDAIGEAETLDAETYKVVITGERTSAMRKGGKNWEGRFGIPVMLTANNMPRVKDQSEATYNRSLIVSMTKIRPEGAPEPAGYTSISEKIGKEELTGLLWWAIEGWQRLASRGHFAEPECMRAAGAAFRDENNPVGAWLRQCIELDSQNKVARLDLVASFNGWRQMEHDDAKPWGSNTITRRIRSQMPQLQTVKLNGETCFCGLRVNEDGLFAWQRTKDTSGFERKLTFSEGRDDVNRFYAGKQDTGKTIF